MLPDLGKAYSHSFGQRSVAQGNSFVMRAAQQIVGRERRECLSQLP